MTRKFTALLLSASFALSAIGTAPARADEDVAKVLAGIATLFIIGKAIDNRNDRKERAQVQRRHVKPEAQYRERRAHRSHRARVAPQRCLRDQQTRRGWRQVYGARCMQNHARAALPQQCLRVSRHDNGPRRFYAPRCLQQNGWRA